jgi:acyl transferase domain-containing protein
VYIGVSYNEYIGLAAAAGGVSTYTATGGSLSVAAGDMSNFLCLCHEQSKMSEESVCSLLA